MQPQAACSNIGAIFAHQHPPGNVTLSCHLLCSLWELFKLTGVTTVGLFFIVFMEMRSNLQKRRRVSSVHMSGLVVFGRFHRLVHCCVKINIQVYTHTHTHSKWWAPVWTVNTKHRVSKVCALFTEKCESWKGKAKTRTAGWWANTASNLYVFLCLVTNSFKDLHDWQSTE